ncbi:hypothetical protein HU200_056147 [Digitaria exilis]|uniref:FBD domain-containing protein n=1 Tax=Digitaria exilis TaxID=1010633 RepID=A0A835E2Q9_9POAL|nr:hypothetical protein HU200_056147 [Digitaria exilis]
MDADGVRCKRCRGTHLASPCCRVGLLRRSPRIRCRVDGEDHISALPDDLRKKIASHLHCARAAANMSLLSNSWHGLWRGLPVLDFHDIAPGPLHAALAQVARPAGSLNICLSQHHDLSAAGATSLLHAAASLEPAKLDVTFRSPRATMELPGFERTTSITLAFSGERVILRLVGDFNALEVLYLENCHPMNLDDLFPHCPHLRKLTISIWPLDSIKVHSSSIQDLDTYVVSSLRVVDIVAPSLRKLRFDACQGTGDDFSLSFSAPLLEDVEWSIPCCSTFGVMWRMWNLTLLKTPAYGPHLASSVEDSCLQLHIVGNPYPSGNVVRSFGQDISRIPARRITILELNIVTGLHVYGAVVLDLLERCTSIEKLGMMLGRCPVTELRGTCPASCPCHQPSNWRSRCIPLFELKVVEVHGFSGEDHEADLLKVILKSAPMLESVNLGFTRNVSPESCSSYEELLNMLEEYPSIQFDLYY